MKPSVLLLLLLLLGTSLELSAQKLPGLDKSPMDVSYYPHDFAHDRKFAPDKIGGADAVAVVRVIYSRPAKKEREVFGKLIPFGKIWRLGANEATEIKFYQDVTFGGKMVKAGTYALFAIPDQNEWTIVLNSELDHWGAYSYKENLDVLRVVVPVKSTTDVVENLAIAFEKADVKATTMRIAWDKTMVEIPVEWK
ncbi:DUF2911 domain-containing protein [Haliscomenobacter hydrossis]|uniref:Asparagine synthetase B n=1 Tax=Haliscomenobacter hydrossis (strain ATCC 27775 / DSM 1100 / LMG 10767 / O) TaxID=760192 RepID=F4L0K2_HALH1|nr:DUF2911 domain-containing protein [Haliscomenobacter hydrossis]AEE48514.1 hypothetical protein Halhy_0605 [Haliscomenobacter hydrossis DSM 1100]